MTKAAGFEANCPSRLVALRSTLKLVKLLLVKLSANVSRSMTLAVFSRPNSGAFSVYEYFHRDNGAGLGASHQSGWTGAVAKLIELLGHIDAQQLLNGGKMESG